MAPSERFGKYKLVTKIADGGMAEVFLAVVAGLGGFQKRVALKKILPHFTRDDSFVKSFVNEARICGQLHHPNLVQVYEFDRIDDSLYLAMEFIEGLDLERIISHRYLTREYIPPPVAVEIVLQMLEGLEYAHTARSMDNQPLNVVHRDLKPSNVLIDYSGVIKIVDFGVAKASNNLYKTMNLGTAKGTVSYMSPEQASGRVDLGPASDVFSVGSILYELLSMRRLFDGENLFQILEEVRAAPLEPRLARLRDVPPALNHVLLKALNRDLAGRYHSAAEMAKELRSVFPEQGPPLLTRFVEQLRGEGLDIPGMGVEAEITPEEPLSWDSSGEGAPVPPAGAGVAPAPVRGQAEASLEPRRTPLAGAAIEPDLIELAETTEWSVKSPAVSRARLRFESAATGEVTPLTRAAAQLRPGAIADDESWQGIKTELTPAHGGVAPRPGRINLSAEAGEVPRPSRVALAGTGVAEAARAPVAAGARKVDLAAAEESDPDAEQTPLRVADSAREAALRFDAPELELPETGGYDDGSPALRDLSGNWQMDPIAPMSWQEPEDVLAATQSIAYSDTLPGNLPGTGPDVQVESLFDSRPAWLEDNQRPFGAPLEPSETEQTSAAPVQAPAKGRRLVQNLVTGLSILVLLAVAWWVLNLLGIRPMEMLVPPAPRDVTLEMIDVPSWGHPSFFGDPKIEKIDDRHYHVKLARKTAYTLRMVGDEVQSVEEPTVIIDPDEPASWRVPCGDFHKVRKPRSMP